MIAADKTILIVDDDIDFHTVAEAILKKSGYKVKSLFEGKLNEVFSLIICCDAVLLDLDMPGENGAEISKQLKMNNETRHIPIIIITANADGDKISQQAAADAFIMKPFSVATLLEKIKMALPE